MDDYLTQKGKKKVAFPKRVGKYDPIKMEWVIPPREVAQAAARARLYH